MRADVVMGEEWVEAPGLTGGMVCEDCEQGLSRCCLVPAPARVRDRVIEQVRLSDAGVRALGIDPPLVRTTPREEFLERVHRDAVEFAATEHPGDGVEAWLRRELFVGMADAVAPVDADMIFGEGRDGTEPPRLRGILNHGGGSYQGGLAYTRELFGDTVPMPGDDDVPADLTGRLQDMVRAALAEHHRRMDAAAVRAIAAGCGVLAVFDDHGLLVSAEPDQRVPFLEVFEVRGGDPDEAVEAELARRREGGDRG